MSCAVPVAQTLRGPEPLAGSWKQLGGGGQQRPLSQASWGCAGPCWALRPHCSLHLGQLSPSRAQREGTAGQRPPRAGEAQRGPGGGPRVAAPGTPLSSDAGLRLFAATDSPPGPSGCPAADTGSAGEKPEPSGSGERGVRTVRPSVTPLPVPLPAGWSTSMETPRSLHTTGPPRPPLGGPSPDPGAAELTPL